MKFLSKKVDRNKEKSKGQNSFIRMRGAIPSGPNESIKLGVPTFSVPTDGCQALLAMFPAAATCQEAKKPRPNPFVTALKIQTLLDSGL